MMLTPHFSFDEMVTTQQRGLDNTPNSIIIESLKTTAELLESVRTLLGFPILVTSGYRSVAVNSAVGGVWNSAHITGCAADFICPRFGDPFSVGSKISDSQIAFDQLIFEYGGWTHIAWSPQPRGERWTYKTNMAPIRGIVR